MLTYRRVCLFLLPILVVAAATTPLRSAYKGHADDRDVDAVLAAYPALKGTPADSCATCHRSGEVKDAQTPGGMRSENHCDYCHAVYVRDDRDARETLNRYGDAYLAAGRSGSGLHTIAAADADGDGFSNQTELEAGTNPGDPGSNPKAPVAPSRAYAVATLKTLTSAVAEVVFVNTTKSRSGDAYNDYRGLGAWALLQQVGIAPTATYVDFLSADGYERTFTVGELKKAWPQAAPEMRLGKADLGPCGWVSYNAKSLDGGKPLPTATVMLAFEQNGTPLEKATPDAQTGRLNGSGPLRLIVPQFQVSPPDLSQTADPSCAAKVAEANRFHDGYDHNGGKSVFAIVAVRVRPLPKDTRDADWQTPALKHLADEQVLIFGALTKGAGK